MFCIGNVNLPNRLILAPMAGVTDLAFRQICREHGAGLTVTEMVSAKAMEFGDKRHPSCSASRPENIRLPPRFSALTLNAWRAAHSAHSRSRAVRSLILTWAALRPRS